MEVFLYSRLCEALFTPDCVNKENFFALMRTQIGHVDGGKLNAETMTLRLMSRSERMSFFMANRWHASAPGTVRDLFPSQYFPFDLQDAKEILRRSSNIDLLFWGKKFNCSESRICSIC